MLRRSTALLVALAPATVVTGLACGTLETSAAADGGADAVATALPPCQAGATFGPFVALDELNTLAGSKSTSTPRLTPDELHIYFESDRDGSLDVWTASRPTTSAAFGSLQKVGGIASPLDDVGATISADERDVFFTRADGGPTNVLFSTRSDPAAAFGPPKDVFAVPNVTIDDPFLLEAPRELWLTLRDLAADGGRSKLHRALPIDDAGAFGPPVAVATTLDPSRHDRFAVVSADRTEVFASSEKDDLAATLYEAALEPATSTPGPFREVTELAGSYALYAGWVSPDHCRLYLSRSRDTEGRIFEIGYAVRQRPSR